MVYNASYDSNDLAPATIDGLTVAIITVVAFVPLVALVLLYGWFRKNVM